MRKRPWRPPGERDSSSFLKVGNKKLLPSGCLDLCGRIKAFPVVLVLKMSSARLDRTYFEYHRVRAFAFFSHC